MGDTITGNNIKYKVNAVLVLFSAYFEESYFEE